MADGKKCVGCNEESWCCCCSHLVLANFLFGLGLLALLFAWIASSEGRPVLGFDSTHLFFDSIAFMVAAIFLRKKL
jgi:hypothetical protein